MAKATATSVVVDYAVVEVRDDRIILDLSRDEAAALLVLANRVGGHANTTSRCVFTDKENSLSPVLAEALGVKVNGSFHDYAMTVIGSPAYFRCVVLADHLPKV